MNFCIAQLRRYEASPRGSEETRPSVGSSVVVMSRRKLPKDRTHRDLWKVCYDLNGDPYVGVSKEYEHISVTPGAL